MKILLPSACAALLTGQITATVAQDDPHEAVSHYVATEEPSVASAGDISAEGALEEGVRGRVTTPDGTPVIGVMVTPRPLDSDGPAVPEIAITTDENGEYTWPLPPGRYEISVPLGGTRRIVQEVTVRAEEVETANFELPSKP